MLELFQTEWCPASHRVRERLTELGVDYVVRQVHPDKRKRDELLVATGSDTVPVLVLEDGMVLDGEERILAYLSEHYLEPRGAWMHRARAEKAHRRHLEEECECSQLATR
jgi:glutathione S-transferase